MLKKNVGKRDRILRIVVGLALISGFSQSRRQLPHPLPHWGHPARNRPARHMWPLPRLWHFHLPYAKALISQL